MSTRPARFSRPWRVIVVLGAATSWALLLPAQPGKPIVFSEPRSDSLTTNVNPVAATHAGLRELESSSVPTLDSFSGSGSLSGALPAPAPSRNLPMQNEEKNPFDPNGSLSLASPEAAMQEMVLRNLLKMPEGQDSRGETVQTEPGSMDRMFDYPTSSKLRGPGQKQTRDPAGSRKQDDRHSGFTALNETPSDWGDPDSSGAQGPPIELGSPFASNPAKPNGLSDIFGLRNGHYSDDEFSPLKKREEQEMKAQEDRFRSLMNMPASPYDASLLDGMRPSAVSGADPFAPMTPATDLRNALVPTPLPTANSFWQPPPLPSTPMPSSLSPVPYLPAPSHPPAPKPVYSVPQRAF